MSDDMVSADEFRKTVALVADKMQKFIDERDAEIERLRAAGDALVAALDWERSCACSDEPLHGLDAEMNARSLAAQRAWDEARRG